MNLVIRLWLVLGSLIYLTCNISFAQEIKLSFGPTCEGNKVICHDPNEVAVCFATDTRIHLEKVLTNGESIDQYQPSCTNYDGNVLPTCVDVTQEGKLAPGHIFISCIEFPKCKNNEDKLTAVCSGGKIAKCLGGDEEPNCALGEDSMCIKGIPTCDYTWQASTN